MTNYVQKEFNTDQFTYDIFKPDAIMTATAVLISKDGKGLLVDT